MPRPVVHQVDAVLDAARDLVLTGGPRSVGIRPIAARAGAPSGSLYHRFGSRDGVLVAAWLRAVRRFQSGFLAALEHQDPLARAARAAHWSVDWALDEPLDARLLLAHGQRDLLDQDPLGELEDQVKSVNVPVARAIACLSRRLYGVQTTDAVERVTYALVDLPYAVVRRHVLADTLTPAVGASVASASVALLCERST